MYHVYKDKKAEPDYAIETVKLEVKKLREASHIICFFYDELSMAGL